MASNPNLPTSYANYNTWNDSIDATVQAYINSGRKLNENIWTGTDKYGQMHYSTSSQDQLNSIINNYNTAEPSELQYTRTKDGTQYVLQSSTDDKGNTTYSTIQKGLYDINNTNDTNKTEVENLYKTNESDIKSAYSGLDAKAKTLYDDAVKTTNSNYDASANSIYSQYRQNQRKLSEQLSRLGATGGASETAQIGQLNTYSKNYANNEGQRNSALQSNLTEYNTNLYNNAAKLTDALVASYGNKTNALVDVSNTKASSVRDYYTGRQAVADEAAAAAQSQKYTVENMKTQAALDLKKEMSAYKQKAEYDASKSKANLKSVNKSNSTKQAECKAARKKGETVFEWYEVNSYGNLVYHWSTDGARARARASAAGTSVYRNGSLLSESERAEVSATLQTK